MVALETPRADIGWHTPDFSLPATDGKTYSLADVKGANGTLIMFICNHCPYVQKQLSRIVSLAKELDAMGIKCVAISSNDAEKYPEDSFENMQKLAASEGFTFPYLYDESQQTAKNYGAICTPDFFGFNADLTLQYRGRLDSSWSGTLENPKREMLEAMQEIAASGTTSLPQNPSIGCSIKWKTRDRKAV